MNSSEHVVEMEAIFKNKNYDFIIGNSDFYNFLGDRQYTTFDSIISSDSLRTLERAVAERLYGKPFVIGIRAEDGRMCEMICRIAEQDDPDCTLIRMWKLGEIVEKHLSSEMDRRETEALLSQYDCVYYSYDRPANTMTCYRYDDEKITLCALKLDEFKKEAAVRLPDNSRDDIEQFTDKLKNGIRSFNGSLSHGTENAVVFSGTAIYDYDVHIKTVGSFGSGGANPIRELVRKDQLTGLALKEDITNYAKRSIGDLKQQTIISIIDIDDFKYVNDHYGHAVGDDVLKKCASIIENETGAYGKAGRIGGDEFFIVFDRIHDKETLRSVLRSIKNNIGKAYSNEKDGFRVTTSIGVSAYPQDAKDFDSLFRLTDYMLYRAKHKGKNRYIIYEAEKHGSVDEILRSSIEVAVSDISGRKGLSKSEVVCRIADLEICGKKYPADNIIRDIVDYFGVERVILYDKTARTAAAQCGSNLLDSGIIAETIDYIYDEGIKEHTQNGVMIVNNVKTFEIKNPELYEKLRRQEIYSIMHREIIGKSGKCFILSCESVSAYLTWNLEDMRFYRILDNILSSVL
ncbi:MAG: diguanylate cyclase [Ruminococcaceae bacterium]|nr:diguanylate cyclase [Oscillospiraceae bacterium]